MMSLSSLVSFTESSASSRLSDSNRLGEASGVSSHRSSIMHAVFGGFVNVSSESLPKAPGRTNGGASLIGD
jgi:hypothetical protein